MEEKTYTFLPKWSKKDASFDQFWHLNKERKTVLVLTLPNFFSDRCSNHKISFLSLFLIELSHYNVCVTYDDIFYQIRWHTSANIGTVPAK